MTIPTNAKPLVLRDYEAQALASGRLGAIVRVVKPQPPNDTDIAGPGWYTPGYIDRYGDFQPANEDVFGIYSDDGEWGLKCPYLPGDYLWCKETWAPFCINKRTCRNSLLSHSNYCFKASPESLRYGCVDDFKCCWHSPVTMPREACRHILRVESIEVCRVQELTEEQAKTLGLKDPYDYAHPDFFDWPVLRARDINQCAFAAVYYTSIKHTDRATYGYEANPWVWFVTVERSQKNDPN